jgi:glutathionylspermidine synthase
VERLGFNYHSVGGMYWNEEAYYEFTPSEVDTLERATNELHEMCIVAAEAIIRNGWYSRLAIPEYAIPLIERSFDASEHAFYGRFDLAFDGGSHPKLLEYNADTPTSLLEASQIQLDWVLSTHPDCDQFNSIHEKLVASWKIYQTGGELFHFACDAESLEDLGNVRYLMSTAEQAGVRCRLIPIGDVQWDWKARRFFDPQGDQICRMFKLYPWEWMVHDEFGTHIPYGGMYLVEPAWKMLLSNKGILPILWELFPGHPNLLPTYTSPEPLGNTFVRKPLLSREGANVTIVREDQVSGTGGQYGEEGFVYQEYSPLPEFDGMHPVVGSWVIGGWSAGIGIREDKGLITGNMSVFTPHLF